MSMVNTASASLKALKGAFFWLFQVKIWLCLTFASGYSEAIPSVDFDKSNKNTRVTCYKFQETNWNHNKHKMTTHLQFQFAWVPDPEEHK